MRKLLFCTLAALLIMLCGAAAWETGAEDEGFAVAAESERRVLLLDAKNARFRLVDKETNLRWDSAVMEGKQGNKTVKNTQKSALTVTYITDAKSATTASMDSYSKSVKTESFTVTMIENGFEAVYDIGDDTFIIDDIPKGIRADKYAVLLESAGWTDKEKKTFTSNYRAVKLANLDSEYMIRIKDDSLSTLLIGQLHGLIFGSGLYTQADMDEDNAVLNYERAYLPSMSVTVRMTLDGDDLLITVPAGQVTFTPENEVISFELTPYFLSADTSQEGFMFVPDGSGALINLNNQKLAATSYLARVYGEDALINAETYQSPREKIALPVFALKRTDSAMLAVIEKGAEIATLFANVSGRSDEYNRIAARFTLREVENVSLSGNESITSPRYAEDVYEGDIVMRYRWLTDAAAGYSEMAQTYRDYLIKTGTLTPREQEETAPFFLEIVGAVTKTKFFLGIPYNSSVQATTIAQAGTIYSAVRAQGIGNIRLIYSGLFTGGVKNASLTSLSLDGGMGSAAELKKLTARLRENGDTLYPGVYLGRVFSTRAFAPLSQAPRKHDGEPAQVYEFGEPVLKRSYTSRPGYYVSPYYLPDYIKRAMNGLKQYDFDGLDAFDLGGSLIGDYKRRGNLSRIHATGIYQSVLDSLSDEYSLLLDSPLLYALPYADNVTALPMSDNGYRITDAAVPFLQMVLNGCVTYSGDSWNLSAYAGVEDKLLWAVESGSAPRFTFTYAEPTIFANTQDMDYMAYFSTQYAQWLEKIAEVYAAYDGYYQAVRGAQMLSHEILPDSLRRVAYSNGVTVYVNYGDTARTLDGTEIPARGFALKEGVTP